MNKPDTLVISGDGAYGMDIRLEPASHLRSVRSSHDDPFRALVLTGADFNGGLRDGLGMFEANVYAPEGFADPDGDRCLLASIEFHSVLLQYSGNGTMGFTGFLAAADAYPQDVYRRIDAGTPLTQIPELIGNWEDTIRYRPPAYTGFDPYTGWKADIRLFPVERARQKQD